MLFAIEVFSPPAHQQWEIARHRVGPSRLLVRSPRRIEGRRTPGRRAQLHVRNEAHPGRPAAQKIFMHA